jgi:hypothetical protein
MDTAGILVMVIAECEVLFEEGKADLVEEGAGAKEERGMV